MAKADASPTATAKNVLAMIRTSFARLVVHVVLDDHLHADAHVGGDRENEQQHDHGDQRRAEDLHHRGMIAAEQATPR